MPKVSIITVCRNAEKTIRDTIESVLLQTWKDVEYIIIDGASTDDTVEIISQYLDQVDHFVSEPDEGMYYALNKALKIASGEIVGIINSDDWYEPDALEKVVEAFSKSDADVVYGRQYMVHDENVKALMPNLPLHEIWHGMPMGHPTVFVKKSVYDRLGGFDTSYRIVADHELMLRFYTSGVKFFETDAVLSNFRLTGISSKNRRAVMDEAQKLMLKYVSKAENPAKETEMIEQRCFEAVVDSYLIEPTEEVVQVISGLIPDKEDVDILGTGYWGGFILKLMEKCGYKVEHFYDNNQELWGKSFCGVEIASPKDLEDRKETIIVTPEKYQMEIKKQIEEYSFTDIRIVLLDELRELAKSILSNE